MAAAAEAAQGGVTASRLAIQKLPLIEGQKQVKALMTGDARWANVRPPLMPCDAESARGLGRELGLLP